MLSAHQVQRLTDHAVRMHAMDDIASLGRAASEALGELVPCDRPVVYFASAHFPSTQHAFSPVRDDWSAYSARLLALAHEDPVYTRRLRLLGDAPESATRLGGRRALEDTALYREVWKPAGLRTVLKTLTPGRYILTLEAARTSAREFDESEAAMMRLVARHLDAAMDGLVERNGMQARVNGSLQPVQMFSWLVCDGQGRVLRSMERAARLLKSAAQADDAREIPQAWRAVLQRRAAGGPPETLWMTHEGCRVSIHIAPIRPTQAEWSVGFLERPGVRDPLEDLMAMGLTRREAEVLRWVAEGKTNADVGVLLGVSALTVKKHLENVFHKLGVENRTMAVVRAMEGMK